APRCGAALVPGTCDRLLVTVEGAERSEALPARATALALADGGLALELADGRSLRVPFSR
ncbi:MAG: hypothetical protein L6R48_22100, partial [Planctomycetes bacterium]|nr:hypothetical protein [Planctomycetota bacterium]